MTISILDWVVIAIYLVIMMGFGVWFSRKLKNGNDYYLAGRNIPPLVIAMSIMATQTSTISLIGAPSFVAFEQNGGLRWLQQEIAVPLAMIVIMVVFVPVLWRSGVLTIYEFLERRFGLSVRLMTSAVFLISRALATGVLLYATALILTVATGAPVWALILIIGTGCLIYSTLGGLVAGVWSDVVQLIVLWGSVFLSIVYIIWKLGSLDAVFTLDQSHAMALDFSAHGLGDGAMYGFWPMLFGGLFLYISYYGTDQTQVQRVLAAPSVALARKSLFINGLLRFPLVLSYCVLGIVLAAFVAHNPQLMHEAKKIDELFPRFIVTYFPKGVVGLIIAGMMAATMSSLDAAFTSLSAATMRDFIERFNWIRSANTKKYMLSARITTFSWGIVCCAFGLMLKGGDTVIVLINKIGSLFYGPMLGVFIVAFLSRWINSLGVIIGLICGISLNVILWFGFHSISWWWWNLFSFVFTVGIACVFSLPDLYRKKFADIGMDKKEVTDSDKYDTMRYVILGLAALAIVLISWGLGQVCMLKG